MASIFAHIFNGPQCYSTVYVYKALRCVLLSADGMLFCCVMPDNEPMMYK